MSETLPSSRTAALNYLSSRQNEDGGWGYLPTHSSIVESTAAAVIALGNFQVSSKATDKALQWLQRVQHSDGGWGMSALDPENTWQTAWSLLALAQDRTSAHLIERGNNWLLEMEQMAIPVEMEQDIQEMMSTDPTLHGWPWHPEEASWVEPTALSLMAVSLSPNLGKSAGRTESGVQYLLDRRCRPGGWNVGNPIMLGAALPARAVPTAFALLALALHAPDSILAEDVAALRTDMALDGGALAIALGLIALRQLGQTDEDLTSRLQMLQEGDGSWNQNVFHTALALIATRDPFCSLWERCD